MDGFFIGFLRAVRGERLVWGSFVGKTRLGEGLDCWSRASFCELVRRLGTYVANPDL